MPRTNLKMLAGVIACASLFTASASAVVIVTPMTLAGEFIVGVADGQPFSPNIANEAVAAQTILNLALGQVDGPYRKNTVYNYTGTIDALSYVKTEDESTSVGAGWDFAIAKYAGPGGGSVLFYLGGQETTLPADSSDFWVNNQGNGYGISHFTTFNRTSTSVPDGGSTLVLLGSICLGLLPARKFLARKA